MPEPQRLEEHWHHGHHPLVAGKQYQACRAGTLFPAAQPVAGHHSQTELKLQWGSYEEAKRQEITNLTENKIEKHTPIGRTLPGPFM